MVRVAVFVFMCCTSIHFEWLSTRTNSPSFWLRVPNRKLSANSNGLGLRVDIVFKGVPLVFCGANKFLKVVNASDIALTQFRCRSIALCLSLTFWFPASWFSPETSTILSLEKTVPLAQHMNEMSRVQHQTPTHCQTTHSMSQFLEHVVKFSLVFQRVFAWNLFFD